MEYTKKDILLKCENLSVTYNNKKILNDINFEIKDIVRPGIQQGQVVSLIGRSGIGKSTLFNSIAGLLNLNNPNTGIIKIGKELKPVKVGDVGVVYQDYYIYPHRTLKKMFNKSLEKNITVHKNDRSGFLMEMVELFDLTAHLDKYPIQLSGGQRQRAAIAEQILNGGDFLLLDEPFSGLDINMIKKVVNLILQLSLTDTLKTIIIVSHDLVNTVALSDTVLVLNYKDGNPVNGATIIKEIDLIERDLSWRKDIKETAAFKETIKEISSLI